MVPNLARGIELTGLDQLWVADITYLRLHSALAYLTPTEFEAAVLPAVIAMPAARTEPA